MTSIPYTRRTLIPLTIIYVGFVISVLRGTSDIFRTPLADVVADTTGNTLILVGVLLWIAGILENRLSERFTTVSNVQATGISQVSLASPEVLERMMEQLREAPRADVMLNADQPNKSAYFVVDALSSVREYGRLRTRLLITGLASKHSDQLEIQEAAKTASLRLLIEDRLARKTRSRPGGLELRYGLVPAPQSLIFLPQLIYVLISLDPDGRESLVLRIQEPSVLAEHFREVFDEVWSEASRPENRREI